MDRANTQLVSGGGGWGAKAGLLSLDPVTVPAGSEADFDFSSFPTHLLSGREEADDKTKALGEIARPGSTVSFFIGVHGLEDPAGKFQQRLTESTEYSEHPYGSTISLGCVRSTIDDVPVAIGESGGDASKEAKTIPGHFSAMSEHGLYMRIKEKTAEGKYVVAKASKVDIPGARIRAEEDDSE